MIAGYCWPHSGVAGDTVDLMISSTGGSCRVEVLRVGAAEQLVAAWEVATAEQPVPDDCAAEGCGWIPTLQLEIDPAWQPGFHLVRLHGPDGEIAEAFFVVRAAEPGETLLVLSTSTWAAYNDWGGPSFYTGGHVSSQQRPLPRGFLDKPDPHRYRVAWFGQLPRAEVADYFDNYSYWSAEMRNHVENWVETGGAVAFFSGNTSFWQVRFGDDDRVIGYKLDFHLDPVMGTDAEHTVSTMWSDPLTGRPESEMTGVSFTRGGYAHCRRAPKGSGGYTIWRPEHWAFDGLRLIAGDVVGAEPVVVGYECDGCELALVNGLPVSAGTGGTPANFEVLGTAPAHLWETSEAPPEMPESYVGELNWVTERLGGGDTPENRERFAYGAAVMGWFRRGHGEVFTTGCTDWAYGLEHHDVATVTRNVIGRYVDLAGGKLGSP